MKLYVGRKKTKILKILQG